MTEASENYKKEIAKHFKSNGAGRALPTTVVTNRPIGTNKIEVSSTLNYPDSFFFTTFSKDQTTGEPTGIQHFFGHLEVGVANSIIIDEKEYGAQDAGNVAGDFVLMKPTEGEQNNLVTQLLGLVGTDGVIDGDYIIEMLANDSNTKVDPNFEYRLSSYGLVPHLRNYVQRFPYSGNSTPDTATTASNPWMSDVNCYEPYTPNFPWTITAYPVKVAGSPGTGNKMGMGRYPFSVTDWGREQVTLPSEAAVKSAYLLYFDIENTGDYDLLFHFQLNSIQGNMIDGGLVLQTLPTNTNRRPDDISHNAGRIQQLDRLWTKTSAVPFARGSTSGSEATSNSAYFKVPAKKTSRFYQSTLRFISGEGATSYFGGYTITAVECFVPEIQLANVNINPEG